MTNRERQYRYTVDRLNRLLEGSPYRVVYSFENMAILYINDERDSVIVLHPKGEFYTLSNILTYLLTGGTKKVSEDILEARFVTDINLRLPLVRCGKFSDISLKAVLFEGRVSYYCSLTLMDGKNGTVDESTANKVLSGEKCHTFAEVVDRIKGISELIRGSKIY